MSKLHLMAGEQDGRVHEVNWTEDTKPEVWYQPTIQAERELQRSGNALNTIESVSTLAYAYRETMVKSYSNGQSYLEFIYWRDPSLDQSVTEVEEE